MPPRRNRKSKKKKGRKKKKHKKIVEDPKVVRALCAAAGLNNVEALNTLLIITNPKDKTYDLKNKAGMALVKAAEMGHLDALKTIINYGGNVNLFGGKALQKAAKNNHLEMVQFLVENDASIKTSKDDFSHMSPLHYAAKEGNLQVMTYLIEAGANVDQQCHERNCGHSNGWAAVHFSADAGHLDCVKLLSTHGAKIDLKTSDGDTALCVAAESGEFNVVRWLVNEGADMHTRKRGLNSTQWAMYRCDHDAVQFLVSCGGKPDLSHRVIWFDTEETLQERLQREFDPALWKRIDLAVYRGLQEMRVRAAYHRELRQLRWRCVNEDAIDYEPAEEVQSNSKDPDIYRFPGNVIQSICAFAGTKSVAQQNKEEKRMNRNRANSLGDVNQTVGEDSTEPELLKKPSHKRSSSRSVTLNGDDNANSI